MPCTMTSYSVMARSVEDCITSLLVKRGLFEVVEDVHNRCKFGYLRHIRYTSTNTEVGKYTKVGKNHVYKAVHPWKTRESLARHLCESVVYNEDGLIAINKPYGVGIFSPLMSNKEIQKHARTGGNVIVETLSSSDLSHCMFSISETLPYVANLLKLPNLRILKSTERYTSGILLLTDNDNVEKSVNLSIRRAKAKTVPFYTFWAVTSSIPLSLSEEKTKVGIKIIDVPEHDQKVAVIDQKLSKNSMEDRSGTKVAHVQYEIAKLNEKFNTALVEISSSSRVWHFPRVYLAYKLAPIIGDALYSTRVKTVLGKPTALSPFNKVCYDPPMLAIKLCNRLQIPLKAVPSLPTHLHLNRITLTGYNKGGSDLLIECPPPDFFMWTCKQLELLPDCVESEVLAA